MKLVVTTLLFMGVTFTAHAHDLLHLAHDWYPVDCCGGRDCHPISCESVEPFGVGYRYQGMEFYGDKVRKSKDQSCHVCISPGTGTGLCIFVEPSPLG